MFVVVHSWDKEKEMGWNQRMLGGSTGRKKDGFLIRFGRFSRESTTALLSEIQSRFWGVRDMDGTILKTK